MALSFYNAVKYNTTKYNDTSNNSSELLTEIQGTSDQLFLTLLVNGVLLFKETSFMADSEHQNPLMPQNNEITRMNDWMSLQIIPANKWSNSDNNNQFPPQP